MPRIAIRGVELYVRVIGHGPPLLLMHGGPGLDHTSLLPLAPLAARHTLIFYDHRCNGRSTGPVESMTWENLAADADALREHLGYREWAVLGHSFGGMVALEYVLRYPRRVTRLVLLDSCGDARWVQNNAPEILRKRGYGPGAVAAARRFYNGRLRRSQVVPTVFRFLGAYFYHVGVRDLPKMAAGALRLRMRPSAHLFGFRHLQTGWTVMDRLHEVRVPTLVAAGRHDFLFPPEHQAILADRIPGARLEIFERAGHNPQDERPGDVLESLARFLGEPSTVARPPARVAEPAAG